MVIDHDDLKSGCRLGLLVGAAAFAPFLLPASTSSTPSTLRSAVPLAAVTASPQGLRPAAEYGSLAPTADVRWLADWVADTRDNGNAEFIVVDKRSAQLHVFDADARWIASTAVLLGAALGDESVPGIGSRPMTAIQPSERTTPAGRFVGEHGRNATGEDVVWVDYGAAVSMHRVRLTHPSERRAERLASPTAADNRISYGCINVPVAFYEQHVRTIFDRQHAVIYVLPDFGSVQEVFGTHAAVSRWAGGSLTLAADRKIDNYPAVQQRPR
jgi:hypothetical protein